MCYYDKSDELLQFLKFVTKTWTVCRVKYTKILSSHLRGVNI
jgi:hypothetical protein